MARYVDIDDFRKNAYYADTDIDIGVYLAEHGCADVAPRAEVAREIFGEICEIMNSLYSRVQHDCVGRHGDDPHTIMLVGKLQGIKYLGDEIAELKKKYTEVQK
jgi:hypothetical protein